MRISASSLTAQVQADNGQYVHRLEPPLADFLPCETDEQGEIVPSPSAPRELPNAVKQLLSFELGREIMRRSRRGAGGGEAGGSAGGSSAAAAGAGAKAAPPVAKAGPKIVTQREPSERRDMFGRVVTAAPARKRKDAPSGAGGASSGAAEPETVQQVRRAPTLKPPTPPRPQPLCSAPPSLLPLATTLTQPRPEILAPAPPQLTPTILPRRRCAINTTRASRMQ